MEVGLERRDRIFELAFDALVIGLYEGEKDTELLKALSEVLQIDLIQFDVEEGIRKERGISKLFTFGKMKSKKIYFLGLGDRNEQDYNSLRKSVGNLFKQLKKDESAMNFGFYSTVQAQLSTKQYVQAITEAAYMASYEYKEFFTKASPQNRTVSILLENNDLDSVNVREGLEVGKAIGESTVYARDLMNAPGNYLTPTALKDQIVQMANKHGFETNVLSHSKLEELKMGGFLGVAKGSAEEPYVVTVKYNGDPSSGEVLGLIGKGVTFDSGGISLKAKAGLEILKKDMGGAATLIGVMDAIGKLKPKVNLLLVVGCVENMPSGSAYKPGDVLTMMNGKTVEIISTDAEGRLVLGDCITYAKEHGATSLIDCATLTGAVRIALGYVAAGVMGNKQEMIDQLLECAKDSGEKAWQLPLYDEYFEPLKSHVAYMKNSGSRFGGAMVAGKFLEQFVDETPWIHLDISSSGYTHEERDLAPVGATGSMISTVTHYILKHR